MRSATLREAEVLALCCAPGEHRGVDLADAYRRQTGLSMARSSLYTTLTALGAHRWVRLRRERPAAGRPETWAQITPAGEEALRQALAEHERFVALARGGLDARHLAHREASVS